MRDLVRARLDAVMQLMRARQQLLSFLLRHGRTYEKRKNWILRHHHWLAGQRFQQVAHQIVFRDYVKAVWAARVAATSLRSASKQHWRGGLGAHGNGPTCAQRNGPAECAAASRGAGSSTESIGGPRASRSDRHESDAAMRGGYLWAPVDEPGRMSSAGRQGCDRAE
jgi:hypothetical protein